jgi:hypothetical protein
MHPPEISELYVQAQGHLRTLIGLSFGLIFLTIIPMVFLTISEASRRTKWLRGLSTVVVIGALATWLAVDGTNTQNTLLREEAKLQTATTSYYKDIYGLSFDYYDDLEKFQLGDTVNAELDGKPVLIRLSRTYKKPKLIASDASEVHEIKPRR